MFKVSHHKSFPVKTSSGGICKSLAQRIFPFLRYYKTPLSVFDKKDPNFYDLVHTPDLVSSELHREGIGAQHI